MKVVIELAKAKRAGYEAILFHELPDDENWQRWSWECLKCGAVGGSSEYRETRRDMYDHAQKHIRFEELLTCKPQWEGLIPKPKKRWWRR